VILDPTTDRECLGKLTKIAREEARTTKAYNLAASLRTKKGVIKWLQNKPQRDDDGTEMDQVIQCDVAQRARWAPDDPNCFERALAAIVLFEILDPKSQYVLVSVDHPLRHTGLVERRGPRDEWEPIDVFPRRNSTAAYPALGVAAGELYATFRNFDWGNFGKDVLQGVHSYVGKPLLSAYGLGGVADTLGNVEDKAIGREKKPTPQQQPQQQQQPAQQRPPQQQPAPQPPQQQPRPVVIAQPIRPQPIYVAPPPAAPLPPQQPESPPASWDYQTEGGAYHAADRQTPIVIFWPPWRGGAA
jgi:hypothetical protein